MAATSSQSTMATAVGSSSSREEREGEGRGVEAEGDPYHRQIANKLADAVMKKLANSDPSKTLTPDHKNYIEGHLCKLFPVFRTPDHPTFAVMIQTALTELNEEHGSTEEAILKFIREHFDCLPWAHASLLSHHLKKLSDGGEIVIASKNCYMLPAKGNDSLSRRNQIPKRKRSERGRGRKTTAKGIEHKKLAEEQEVEVTEPQREHGQQSKEPNHEESYSKLIDDQNGSPKRQNEQQDEVNGQKCQKQMQEIAMIVKEQNNAKQNYKGTEQPVEVTEQQREHGQQSQEPSLEEQHSKKIDDQNGSPDEQQDEVNGQQSEKQMQEIAVTVEKQNIAEQKCKVTEQQREHGQLSQQPIQEEQHSKVIDYQNGSPEKQIEQQDEVNGQKSQNKRQAVAVIVENQNIAEHKYKVTEEQVEVTEQQREHGQQSQEPSQEEQHSMVIDCGSPEQQNEHQDEVNGQKSQKQLQEIAVTVEKQNIVEHKYEVTEQQREHGKQNQEPCQEGNNSKGIDHQNGSPEQQNEQQDEVNGQQSKNKMQDMAVIVENQINAKMKYKATQGQIKEREDELIEEQCQTKEPQCEMIEEQLQIEGSERQIQLQEQVEDIEKLTKPGQKSEMISEQNQLQEQIELICKIVTSGNMQELLSKKQEKNAAIAINSNPFLTSEKLLHHGPLPLSKEDCIELLMLTHKMQEKLLVAIKLWNTRESNHSSPNPIIYLGQEKDAASAINSNPSLTSQKSLHHGQLPLSKEDCIELMMTTHKMQEKLLEAIKLWNTRESNRSTPKPIIDLEQEKNAAFAINSNPSRTSQKLSYSDPLPLSKEDCIELLMSIHKMQEKLLEAIKLLNTRESNHSTLKPIIALEERPMAIASPCGEREYRVCGLPAQQKQQPEISDQRKSFESQPNEMSESLELPIESLNLEMPVELFPKQGKLANSGSQQQVPKCQNKSIKTFPDVEHPQQQEIGNSESLLELSTMEPENGEVSGPDLKRTSLNFEAKNEKEEQLVVQNAESHPDLCNQQKLSVSLPATSYEDVSLHSPKHEMDPKLKNQQPKLQKPERPQDVKLLSVEGGYKAHEPMPNIMVTSVDFPQASEELDRDLTIQENPQELLQKMQSLGQGKQKHAIHSGVDRVVKALDCQVETDDKQLAENLMKEKVAEHELTPSEQTCQKQQEQQEQQQQRQLHPRVKKPSESDCGVAKAPKFQDGEEQQAKKAIEEETGEFESIATKQSCQTRHQARDQQQLKGLGPQDQRPSSPDHQAVVLACQELEHEHQPRDPVQERIMKLGHIHEPAQQRKLRPRGQRQSKSELSITTTMVELSPAWHQDTQVPKLQEIEKPQELKISAAGGMGQTQQQRQLRPRGKKLSESEQVTTRSMAIVSPLQPLHEHYPLLSNTGSSQMQNLGLENSSQLKKQQANDCNQRKRCTPEPTTMSSASGLTIVDDLSQPMVEKMNHQGQQKKFKSKPTTTEAGELSKTLEELKQQQKQKQLRHMQLRSHSQGASQSEPSVSMTESLLSQHHREKPPEKKHQRVGRPPKLNPELPLNDEHHDELQNPKRQERKNPPRRKGNDQQPQKRGRGRPPKLDTAQTGGVSLPSKFQKQQEQPEKRGRGRPPKLDANTVPGNKLTSKNQQQQQKPRGRGRPPKVTE